MGFPTFQPMDLDHYLNARRERARLETQPRTACPRCRRALVVCYCRSLRPFASNPAFVILIHRDEARRGVATGRMAHLGLSNSMLIEGTDFSADDRVNGLLRDPANFPMVLYPARSAINLSELSPIERASLVPAGRRAVIFVIDGTWASARRMRRLSVNLHALPVISFTPGSPSIFRVRKQPSEECLSTIEAVHRVIDLFRCGPEPARPHDNLLDVFRSMIAVQVDYETRIGHRRRRVKQGRNV